MTIEKEIEKMDANIGVDYFCSDRSSNIKDLFLKRRTILDHKAETLRQKSRAIWLQAGDENTKYFHSYANRQRISNSIWEVSNEGGNVVSENDTINVRKQDRRAITDIQLNQ